MGVIFCSFAPFLRLFVTCIISWVGATLDFTRVAFIKAISVLVHKSEEESTAEYIQTQNTID